MRASATILALSAAVLCSQGTELRGETASGYTFETPAQLNLEVGGSVELRLGISPAKGYRVDKNAPVRIELRQAKETGVSIKKSQLRRRDAVDAQSGAPHFLLPIVGGKAGRESLAVAYRFWLCRAKICRPIRGEASITLIVDEPSVPDGGPLEAPPMAKPDR